MTDHTPHFDFILNVNLYYVKQTQAQCFSQNKKFPYHCYLDNGRSGVLIDIPKWPGSTSSSGFFYTQLKSDQSFWLIYITFPCGQIPANFCPCSGNCAPMTWEEFVVITFSWFEVEKGYKIWMMIENHEWNMYLIIGLFWCAGGLVGQIILFIRCAACIKG